jgi:hypothetical protein
VISPARGETAVGVLLLCPGAFSHGRASFFAFGVSTGIWHLTDQLPDSARPYQMLATTLCHPQCLPSDDKIPVRLRIESGVSRLETACSKAAPAGTERLDRTEAERYSNGRPIPTAPRAKPPPDRPYNMPPLVPQQFDMEVYDSYQTHDPAAPIVGTDIQGTVSVTINWNANRTDLTDQGVQFSDVAWSASGNGPLTVYSDAIGGGLQPIGTVAWKVATSTLKSLETDTPNKQVRLTITPQVQLVRTLTSQIGDPPDTEVVNTATETAKGNWTPQS